MWRLDSNRRQTTFSLISASALVVLVAILCTDLVAGEQSPAGTEVDRWRRWTTGLYPAAGQYFTGWSVQQRLPMTTSSPAVAAIQVTSQDVVEGRGKKKKKKKKKHDEHEEHEEHEQHFHFHEHEEHDEHDDDDDEDEHEEHDEHDDHEEDDHDEHKHKHGHKHHGHHHHGHHKHKKHGHHHGHHDHHGKKKKWKKHHHFKKNTKKKEKPKYIKMMKKYMVPLLMAYKLKFLTMVPVFIKGLMLLAATTGLAGFFFALFATSLGFRNNHH